MPQPRKPTNLLELTGAFKNHPSRLAARNGEPVPDGPLGSAPRHWWVKHDHPNYAQCQELCKLWREVSRMAPWLTSADRHTVEDVCDLRLKARQGTIRPGERNVLRALSNACGLDPSGRLRINCDPVVPKAARIVDPRDVFGARGNPGKPRA
jgi:hypothetical protein